MGAAELGRLRWRCRRGAKELDVLLSAYLERHYARAGAAEQADFQRLLEYADPDLLQLLLGNLDTDDQGIADLARKIRRAAQH